MLDVLSDEELFAEVREIEARRCRDDARESALLAEIDAREAADRHFGLRTWSWLAREAGLSTATAKSRLEVGIMLRTWLPETAAALARGDISFDHATVMARACNPRIRDEFALVEGELVALAEGMVFSRWADRVRDIAAILDQDGAFDPNEDLARNKLSLRPDLDALGGLNLDGYLSGERRLVVEQVLNDIADELYRQHVADKTLDPSLTVPKRTTLLALALVEACRRAITIDTTKPGVAPRTDATLVIQATDLSDVRDEAGVRLQNGSVACLMCDLRLHPVVVNSLGVPLDLGREVRWATAPQKRALRLRDGGCVFPGCGGHVGHTDAHHVDEWDADHGATDVKRMVLLCRHHHGVVHRNGWKVDIDDDGWATFTTPGGVVIDGQRHGRRRAGPLAA